MLAGGREGGTVATVVNGGDGVSGGEEGLLGVKSTMRKAARRAEQVLNSGVKRLVTGMVRGAAAGAVCHVGPEGASA
jgi:hypothetical protein